MASDAEMDLSAFMAVLIMTIGCLVILLVTNVIVIISNPENLSISTILVRAYEDDPELDQLAGVPLFSNEHKEPFYVDVHTDRLVLYPGEEVVPVSELNEPGNAFERLLEQTEQISETHYIITVLRPGTSQIARRLRMAILDRGIDYGQELFEEGQVVHYRPAATE